MARGVGRLEQTGAALGWGASALAGIVAGIGAGLASVIVEIVTAARVPPPDATFWSALVAGLLGGLLYGWLCRVSRRPIAALWVITLAIATIDSLLIATLPLAAGRNPSTGIPIYGLVVPLRQILALAGIGHFGRFHFPARYLAADTATHYVTAIAVSLIVPWLARGRRA